ncbi:MAG: putative Ig domain-containing protein, partial [Candidatus Poribacteria bacterium]|nr:putative Ig domain-containing protein [Candidatus Poribacteria bacterium]
MVINSSSAEPPTTPNRYQLPTTTLTNTSTIIDLELKFTKPMNPASITASTLRLQALGGAAATDFVFKLDDALDDSKLNVWWEDGYSRLRITTQLNPLYVLLEQQTYQLKFIPTNNNPRDGDDSTPGNPLDLGSMQELAFSFTTGDSPEIGAIANVVNLQEGVSISPIYVTVTDNDGDSIRPFPAPGSSYNPLLHSRISYTRVGGGGEVTGLPSGLTFTATGNNGFISGTPGLDAAGTYTLNIKVVSDHAANGLEGVPPAFVDEETFTLTIKEAPPIIDAITSQKVEEGQFGIIPINAYDPLTSGSPQYAVTKSLVSPPSWVTLAGNAILAQPPLHTVNSVGSPYTVTFRAYKSGDPTVTTSRSFSIDVTE